jgi:hypothetical protein
MNGPGTKYATKRSLYILLLVFFSLAYMEWGGGNHSFVFQVQLKVFTEPAHLIANLTHPVILVGFAGQLVLLLAFFHRGLRSGWIATAIVLLGVPIALILLSGAVVWNIKVVASTLPFLGLATWLLLDMRSGNRPGHSAGGTTCLRRESLCR